MTARDADAPIGAPADAPAMETVEGVRALVVPVAGDVREVVLVARDRDGYLGALREHVGAEFLDVVGARTDGMSLTIWLDDEGLLNARAANPRIGDLLATLLGVAPYFCGDAVITGPADDYGDTTSLTATARDELTARWS